MIFWIASAVGWAAAYLLGATPTGYLAGKWLKGVDIRAHGSKSIGATNVLRTLGPWPALLVFSVDVAKGAAAIAFAGWYFAGLYDWPAVRPPPAIDQQIFVPWAVCAAGIAVLVGHSRSIWLNFTGGKSIAAGLGVLLALSWPVALGALTAFSIAIAASRIVSLGSMLGALTAVALTFVFELSLSYQLLVVAGSTYLIMRHRENIRRLWAGVEPRLGQKI